MGPGSVPESCMGHCSRKESAFPIRDQGATFQEKRSQAKVWLKIVPENTPLSFHLKELCVFFVFIEGFCNEKIIF